MPGNRIAYTPSLFAQRLRAHMAVWRARTDGGDRSIMWPRWTDGIYAPYRDLASTVQRSDDVRLHKYAPHLLSSQAFAFNLFLPFWEGNRRRLSACVSALAATRLTIDRLQFEWVPPGRLLGEIVGERPVGGEPATAADVLLWCRLDNGQRAAVLIEVKLSEGDFTHCGGRYSRGNRRQDVCKSARLFMRDPSACYLRRPVRQRRDRRYWEIFAQSHGSVLSAFPQTDLDGSCPFAEGLQQPMRNLAIARGMEQEGIADQAWFALCAHDANLDISARWAEWSRLLPEPSHAPVLPASEIVRAGEAEGLKEWADYMRERYQL